MCISVYKMFDTLNEWKKEQQKHWVRKRVLILMSWINQYNIKCLQPPTVTYIFILFHISLPPRYLISSYSFVPLLSVSFLLSFSHSQDSFTVSRYNNYLFRFIISFSVYFRFYFTSFIHSFTHHLSDIIFMMFLLELIFSCCRILVTKEWKNERMKFIYDQNVC